uniref:Uncharacterized protein n=1 Tax=Utricularia reniformis TaxID=192314 RepID=A0A1Y0B356_9LAMI|nr:hypothetical protein AEK19_MT1680 [Utricularia reniformis]ART31862.1 hypothetical protein AEK19_MT1680 [Utricularia reniformis]
MRTALQLAPSPGHVGLLIKPCEGRGPYTIHPAVSGRLHIIAARPNGGFLLLVTVGASGWAPALDYLGFFRCSRSSH